MLLRLIVIKGPREGEEILLRGAVVIGRKGVDLTLQDSKVSSQHAKIYEDLGGQITIEDLGSSNGTYVNDVKITSQILKVGDKITIGTTSFKIAEEPSPQVGIGKGSWQDIVEDSFTETLKALERQPSKPQKWGVYNTPITLEFVKGLQTGANFVYGFGPRKLGRLCPDGLLLDPKAPDVAFVLVPSKDGLCELRTDFRDLKLNEKNWPVKTSKEFREKLKDGDRISFGQTVIVVKAFKDP